MATREEIRERIESVIQRFEDDSPDAGYGYEKELMAREILQYLHSQGVAIKVDGARCYCCDEGHDDEPCTCSDPNPTGTTYSLVKPLIEEG